MQTSTGAYVLTTEHQRDAKHSTACIVVTAPPVQKAKTHASWDRTIVRVKPVAAGDMPQGEEEVQQPQAEEQQPHPQVEDELQPPVEEER